MRKKIRNKTGRIETIAEFAKFKFSTKERKAAEIYPFLASNYYLALIGKDIRTDPIFMQCFPDSRELVGDKHLKEDPLAEEKQMPVPGLIHRYSDRVVLLVTNRCAVHCRFCLRKRKWKEGNQATDISDNDLKKACRYIAKNRGIREVLISGGDPLMLDTDRLKTIFTRISGINSIDAIRLGTRMPVVLPSRINRNLVRMLSRFKNLWLMTHFNHPVELTKQSKEACRKLVRAGIPLLNQSVLLKGINDKAEILEELFRGLVKIQVKPHYLFHVDPAEGNIHFRTGITRGLEILDDLRPRLSSLCTPVFAIDLPEGGGKVPLLPQYRKGKRFLGIDGKEIKYF